MVYHSPNLTAKLHKVKRTRICYEVLLQSSAYIDDLKLFLFMTNWVIVLSVPVQFSWAIAAWHEIILILIFNLQMSRIPREKPIP